MSRIKKAEPKNMIDYFKVISKPSLQKNLDESESITPIVTRICEELLFKSERLAALGEIFSACLENDTAEDNNFKLILDALENLSPNNLVTLLDHPRLKDGLGARLYYTQKALITRLNSLINKYQNTLTQITD
jgi:hypothetical protein